MGLAAEADIDAKVFATKSGLPRTEYGMKDSQILKIMRDRNPDFAKFITEKMPKQQEQEMLAQEQMMSNSFLGVDESVIEGELVEETPAQEMAEERMEGEEE
jgi:hypothetical protein